MERVGYAIISADGLIADARGEMPDALRFEADWLYFQDALSVTDLALLGRGTHAAAPNPRRRRRLVVSSRPAGLEQEDEVTWWCNPATVDLGATLAQLAGPQGRVAVVGGTGVYDLVRRTVGYTGFHLSIAHGVELGAGRRLFGAAPDLPAALELLAEHGLGEVRRTWLDRAVALELVVHERPDDKTAVSAG
jgi:dihydrofolate reductase